MCLVEIGFSKPKIVKKKSKEQSRKDVLNTVVEIMSTDNSISRIFKKVRDYSDFK